MFYCSYKYKAPHAALTLNSITLSSNNGWGQQHKQHRKEELILAPQGVVPSCKLPLSHDRHLSPRLISTVLKDTHMSILPMTCVAFFHTNRYLRIYFHSFSYDQISLEYTTQSSGFNLNSNQISQHFFCLL